MGHVRYLPNKLPAKSLYQQMFISGCLHINEHSISCRCWLSNTKYFFSQDISNGWRNRWKERYFIENVSSVVAKCQNEQKNNSEKAWDVFLGLSKLHRRWRNNFSQIPKNHSRRKTFFAHCPPQSSLYELWNKYFDTVIWMERNKLFRDRVQLPFCVLQEKCHSRLKKNFYPASHWMNNKRSNVKTTGYKIIHFIFPHMFEVLFVNPSQ